MGYVLSALDQDLNTTVKVVGSKSRMEMPHLNFNFRNSRSTF